MTNPIPYKALCRQTVTLYHKHGDAITRRTVQAHFEDGAAQTTGKDGVRETGSFLLVVPAGGYMPPRQFEQTGAPEDAFTIDALDKVFLGDGPEITDAKAWAEFRPGMVDNLRVVRTVELKHYFGALAHLEAKG